MASAMRSSKPTLKYLSRHFQIRYPREDTIDKLPKMSVGKINKMELRKEYGGM